MEPHKINAVISSKATVKNNAFFFIPADKNLAKKI